MAAGLDASGPWAFSFKEVEIILQGRSDQLVAEHNGRMLLAFQTAMFQRVKRLGGAELKKVMARPSSGLKRKQSRSEMMAIVKVMAATLGMAQPERK